MEVRRWGLVCAALVLGSACASGTGRESARETSAVSSTTSSPGDPTTTGCRLPPQTSTDPASWMRRAEVHGRADRGTLWALLPDRRAGPEVKTIWRMTGSGDLSVVAVGPDGQRLRPAWGPKAHEGSNWARPGSEWGVGWTIPEPGRWTFEVQVSGGNSGTLAAEFC